LPKTAAEESGSPLQPFERNKLSILSRAVFADMERLQELQVARNALVVLSDIFVDLLQSECQSHLRAAAEPLSS